MIAGLIAPIVRKAEREECVCSVCLFLHAHCGASARVLSPPTYREAEEALNESSPERRCVLESRKSCV